MFSGQRKTQRTVSIATGQTVSGALLLGTAFPIALRIPAAFTGVTVSFQGSHDGVTYKPLFDGAALYAVTVTADKDVAIKQDLLSGYQWLKVVSASAEGADRTLILFLRRDA
jgi:hypothetical protein